MVLDQIFKLDEEYKGEIDKLQHIQSPIILFGAGCTSDFIVEQFNGMNIYPVAFCDNDRKKVGTKIAGLPVMDINGVRRKYPDAYFYITTQLYYSVLQQQLNAVGVESENISEYDLIFQLRWEKEFLTYCQEHESELETLYELLADDESRNVLFQKLAFYRTRKRKYVTGIRENNQYFDERLIDFKKIHSFVDLGMYTGDTILEFLKVAQNDCEIWGFEPDNNIALLAEKALLKHMTDKIHIVKKATSDCSGLMAVKNSLGVMQSVVDGTYEGEEPGGCFDVCTLDEFFKENPARLDFIKMDIEGAEYQTLIGGKTTIMTNVPVLAVCVYHKKEDLFTIPQYILKLNNQYQLYLRHYSDNSTETVCYAIPASKE